MATFSVINTDDSGLGSLRQAIEDANATAGLDTIEFDEELSGQKIPLISGELQITDDLTINGLGADELTVSGNNNSRVFKVDDGNDENQIAVNINDLTITEGVARGGEAEDDGGGIFTVEDLTVSNSIISDNVARNNGGGIWNQRGTIQVLNSTISNNTSEESNGGGIANFFGGTLQVTDSIISGNTGSNGAGIYDYQGFAQITNSTISSNSGLGIFIATEREADGDSVSGSAEITNSSISDNAGGIESVFGGMVKVTDSTISGNADDGIKVAYSSSAEITNSNISDNGVGISAQFGGQVEMTNSTISDNADDGINAGNSGPKITNSTISGNGGNGITLLRSSAEVNNSTISGNADGGIVVVFTSFAEVTNSTISGNEGSGGIAMGINGSAKVSNSTITDNTTTTGGGGGISFQESAVPVNTIVENTIIAGNFDNSPAESDLEPDVSGNFTSGGYNIIGDGTGSTGFDATGDLVGTSDNPIDPLLGPLQDNGGSTQTHALLAGSPAIDAGNPDFEPPPEFDQRGVGFPRFLDGNGDGTATVDIGAFEFINIIDGTPDNDLLVGTPGSDRINGFDGNDLLLGRDSDDILNGGSGNDSLFGHNSNDSLLGGDGQDFLVGETGDDFLDGGADNDNLIGSSGTDQFVLREGDGGDTIFDYRDGTDSFLLADGLAFEDLTITQGIGQSVISVTDTSEDLAALFGVNANDLGAEDFSTLV